MKTITISGYEIAGNDFVSIAINMKDPMTAFDRAIAWTSPGA